MSEAMDRKRAEIEALVAQEQKALSLLLKTEGEVELLLAAREGSLEVVQKLLAKGGFSLEAKDESGMTALALAANGATPAHLEIARILLAAGANVNSESARRSRPLHFACLNRYQVLMPYRYQSHPNLIIMSLLISSQSYPNSSEQTRKWWCCCWNLVPMSTQRTLFLRHLCSMLVVKVIRSFITHSLHIPYQYIRSTPL